MSKKIILILSHLITYLNILRVVDPGVDTKFGKLYAKGQKHDPGSPADHYSPALTAHVRLRSEHPQENTHSFNESFKLTISSINSQI